MYLLLRIVGRPLSEVKPVGATILVHMHVEQLARPSVPFDKCICTHVYAYVRKYERASQEAIERLARASERVVVVVVVALLHASSLARYNVDSYRVSCV